LETNRGCWFWAAAALGGLAFSCKYTAILLPPILAAVWWIDRIWIFDPGRSIENQPETHRIIAVTRKVALGMLGFLVVMLLANFIVTAFARLPLSTTRGHHPTIEKWMGSTGTGLARRVYETPLPQDWVGFATQMHYQASGGPSYLWGQRRIKGWWYYYPVALSVKVPLVFWLLLAARLAFFARGDPDRSTSLRMNVLPLACLLYLAIAMAGSARNYGVRYLLPLAPLAIVWVSALAENRAILARAAVAAGLAGYAAAVAGIHPHELTYFNFLAGGPLGGRRILSDSNLDWGQGLKAMARLQHEQPEFRDVTFYYFGDTDPAHYGVAGRCHVINAVGDHSAIPSLDAVQTPLLAVSASLQYGPWGPPGFFRILDSVKPVRLTDDATIAIYRTADLLRVAASSATNAACSGVAQPRSSTDRSPCLSPASRACGSSQSPGNTVDEPLLVSRPATAFGQDSEQPIRLRLALPAENRCGVVQNLHSGRLLGVVVEPHDHRHLGYAVGKADRAGQIHDSIDQLSPRTLRHRFVKRVERGLIEPLALDQRSGRFDHLHALGHDLNDASIETRLDLLKPTWPCTLVQAKRVRPGETRTQRVCPNSAPVEERGERPRRHPQGLPGHNHSGRGASAETEVAAVLDGESLLQRLIRLECQDSPAVAETHRPDKMASAEVGDDPRRHATARRDDRDLRPQLHRDDPAALVPDGLGRQDRLRARC
jgi:hypothetical protein